MIVDPDFFDHWKTQMLVDLSKDDSSPLWILRLWSFAQARRTGTFDNLPPAAIKAVTKAKGCRAEQIDAWLEEAGFIRRKGLKVVLHQWEEYNRGLFANWKNGALGGRPRKPEENPSETHGLPTDNPIETDRVESNERVEGKEGNPPTPPEEKPCRKCAPTKTEAMAYSKSKQGWKTEATVKWWNTREQEEWLDRKDRPITNWKLNLENWQLDEHRNGTRPGTNGKRPLEYDPEPPTHFSTLTPQEKAECAAFFREQMGAKFTTLDQVPNGEIGNWKRIYRHEAAKQAA